MKIEWNNDNEICVDDGVWRSATPVEMRYRDALERIAQSQHSSSWKTCAECVAIANDALGER